MVLWYVTCRSINSVPVAEHTIALMLALVNRYPNG